MTQTASRWDPRDQPSYSLKEAALYVALPASTVRAWTMGQLYPTTREGRKLAPPLLNPARKAPPVLSFWNLVEIYVLASIRREHAISMPRVRKALSFVETRLHVHRPLISEQFFTDGVDLFVERYSKLMSASTDGQLDVRDLLLGALKRIERDPKGLASRMFPWIDSTNEPRSVEIDPTRAFGRLVVAGTGIPTESIAERFRAGDSIGDLAADFRLKPQQIESALRWEQRAATA